MLSRPSDCIRVLITGAGGFIGRHAVSAFEQRGFEVRIASRDAEPDLDVDVVLHLAGVAHVLRPSARDLTAFRAVNVEATARLALAAARAGVKRFVLLSSAGVFGAESSAHAFTRDDPVRPEDPYTQSKADGERAVQQACAATNTGVVIVRAPMVYGPAAPGNFSRLARFVARGLPLPLAGLNNRRSMVSVWNLCDFLAVASLHPHATSIDPAEHTWLVSDGHDVSTTELIESMAAALGRPPRLFRMPKILLTRAAELLGRDREIRRLIGSFALDIASTRRLLGWRPPLTFDRGIARSVSANA